MISFQEVEEQEEHGNHGDNDVDPRLAGWSGFGRKRVRPAGAGAVRLVRILVQTAGVDHDVRD